MCYGFLIYKAKTFNEPLKPKKLTLKPSKKKNNTPVQTITNQATITRKN